MKDRFLLLLLLFLALKSVEAQGLSVDIPIEANRLVAGTLEQPIPLEAYEISDFLAISSIFEGAKMHPEVLRCSIKVNGKWIPIPHFGEAAQLSRYVSELYYVPADGVRNLSLRFEFEAGIDASDIQGRIHLFTPERHFAEALEPEATRSAACPCPQPAYIARTSWGASLGLTGAIYTPPAVYTDVTHLIVHHSAGTNNSSNWPGVVASIFDYHVNTNGWSDVGYNWLIDPNGVIYEGRGGGDNVRGAHMCGYNNNTMGVCLLGNFVNVAPPPLALEALSRLFAWKCCKEAITPEGNGPIASYTGNMKHISGHRDGCSPGYTECPGGLLYAQLNQLREATINRIDNECSNTTGLSATAQPLAFTLTPNPAEDIIRLQWVAADQTRTIHLLNMQGQEFARYSITPGSEAYTISVRHLPPGIYRVVVLSEAGAYGTRFVKF